ncbi:MAG: oxidoreductase [Phycisphaeraceae bacterium]|nr:oxidoreductase [Phycisphaeraceae bacterium]
MSATVNIGLVGLDTSHVAAFTSLLNDAAAEHHVSGARVVAAFPGGSEDFELSWSRVEGYTAQLRDEHAVRILDSPRAVAEAVDLVMITAVDGRAHLDLLRQTVACGRPTFIDKPIATTLADARAIFDLAGEAGVPLMSSSSLRYAEPLVAALQSGADPILSCDIQGSMSEVPTQPGLFWYGIHAVEMLVTIMGTGWREVRAVRMEDADMITFVHGDGRLASIRGIRRGAGGFTALLHREEAGMQFVNAYSADRPPYAALLEAILRSLPHGVSDVPAEETLEVVRLIEAANESRDANGRPVAVA